MTNNPAGSAWSKWDLHVHTPASIINNYGGNDDAVWDKFIADLESLPADYKVLGINDYIFIDGYERLLKEKTEKQRLKNIDLLLPVIELRIDKFTGVLKKGADGSYSKSDWNRINVHVIFDQLEPELIRQQFLNGLVQSYQLIPEAQDLKWKAIITRETLTQLGQLVIDSVPVERKKERAGPLREGFNNLCFSLDGIREALDKHDLENHFLLAIGKTEWADMKWDDHSIAEKKNIINKMDLVFTAAESPAAYKTAREQLQKSKVKATLLDCSDAHSFSNSTEKDRLGNCFTWIKADPTFLGLRHAVAEFEQRVFIGDTPSKKLLVDGNRTKYVSSIEVRKKKGSTLSDEWFDVRVPLNHDLVAIIGNKGSGKSALADIAALVGNTRNFSYFSFLNESRFRNPRGKLSSHFIGTLEWEDHVPESRSLDENPPASSVERIKYLPQSYLETLCNELAVGGSTTFDKELRKIIYTHVPVEEQLGFASLDELLGFKVAEIEEERGQYLEALSKVNAEIAAVEAKLSPAYRLTLGGQLSAKKNELTALEGAKPAVVEDPKQSEAVKEAVAAATQRLEELGITLKDVSNTENAARQKKGEALRRTAHIARISQALRNHQKVHQQFTAELTTMLGELGTEVKAGDLTKLVIDTTPIDSLAAEAQAVSEQQDAILNDRTDASLFQKRAIAEEEVAKIKGQLGEGERLFLVYKDQLAQWEAKKAEIQGDETKPSSIAGIQAELHNIDALPDKRSSLKQRRIELVRSIHQQIKKVGEEYRLMYAPIQRFVENKVSMDMPFPLDFNVLVSDAGFQDGFISRINRQARGSFSGVEESGTLIRELMQETDLSDVDAVIALVDKIDDMLHFDRRPGSAPAAKEELSVLTQLRRGQRVEELYDYIFGLSYLSPKYSLTYSGQEISQLSPGERGLLLLVFYLLVDKDDIPLVIDQPEENLDNQTIYKVLVTCIKSAKERRQVIMVTHNPNLAVVCDAEQIIYATCDKANKIFKYETGAIEAPNIKAHVLEILEGTQPAFDNRRLKYGY